MEHRTVLRHSVKHAIVYRNLSIIFRCSETLYDYIYGTMWRCRACGVWESRIPEDTP